MAEARSTAEARPIRLPTERARRFDPPPELARLREQQPMCRLLYPDGHVGWLVTSYALGRAVLADERFSMRPRRLPVGDPVTHAALHDAMDQDPASRAGDFLFLDSPEHTRLRQMLTAQFTVRRVDEHRPRIQEIVAGLLDALEAAGPPADLVKEFALQVSALTHCALLGVAPEDSGGFVRPAAVMVDPHTSADAKLAAWDEFRAFVRSVVRGKRAQPADDLLSDLVRKGEASDDEIVGSTMLLFGAGHDTTASMIALSTFVLLCHPDQLETLRADPASIDTAVEELLRYLTLFQVGAFPRTALEDVELGGVVIGAGESVSVSLSAANRDPERFEHPDTLDVSRAAKGHLAFGNGRHMCLGQHLARVELQAGLAGLIGRFPALRLAVPADAVPLYSADHIAYGVERLPVAW